MTLVAPGWRVTLASIDGQQVLIVEQETPRGWLLPGDRNSGRCTSPEQVREILGEDAFAALAPAA